MGEFRKNDRSSSGGSRRLALGPKPAGGPKRHLGVKIPRQVSPTVLTYRKKYTMGRPDLIGEDQR